MSYKFIKLRDPDNRFDNTVVEHTVEATTIPELLEAFEIFMKGCGFMFDGDLEIVEEEE